MTVQRETFNYQKQNDVLFIALIALLLYPVFAFDYILTHDGPAHVYNAALISRLLSGGDVAKDFLYIKSFPEPNWLGHFILLLLQKIFSPAFSEKFFQGAYIILLPVYFRLLLKKVNTVNRSNFLLMIIPFVYSYFFIGGLYNFITGVIVLFAALGLILPELENPRRKTFLKIFFFSMLLYLSHLVVLGIFLLMLVIAILFEWRAKTISNKKFIGRILLIVLSLLPSLIFLIVFFSEKLFLHSGGVNYSIDDTIHALLFILPVVTLQSNPEETYAAILFGVFVVIFLILIFSNRKPDVRFRRFYEKSSYWIICSVMMLLLFILLPDQAASGGVIKFRFEYFFFLFLIVFFTTLHSTKVLTMSISIFVMAWIIAKSVYLFPKLKELSADVSRMMKVSDHIENNTIILPLNYTSNWMHCNILNYIAAEKPVLVLDNYEAGMPHFPLEWKTGMNPVYSLGKFNIEPPPLCADVNAFEIQTQKQIDYILVYRYQQLEDSCSIQIRNMIAENYNLVYRDEDVTDLYKRKK